MKQIRTFLLLAALIFTANALGQDTKSATTPSASTGPQSHQPPAVRVVDLKASDGTILKASYFAAAKPGPGVLLLHQSNRTRDSWDGLARQLAAAGINTLTLDMRGFGESGGTPNTKLTDEERAKVRSSFCTLKSYLSSGKSWAMAISLFPMSFHLSTISSDRARAGLGA